MTWLSYISVCVIARILGTESPCEREKAPSFLSEFILKFRGYFKLRGGFFLYHHSGLKNSGRSYKIVDTAGK